MILISWNVNGLRAATKNGIWPWIEKFSPDILLLQETKVLPEQLEPEIRNPGGYKSYFYSAEKKGYSGVAAYVKKEPENITNLGIPEFDSEGRVMVLEYPGFTLVNTYFPNSQEKGKRLDYKLRFCREIHNFCNDRVSKGENIILCGDYNIAHTSIDLKNPKTNEKNPGYLPEERAWMDKFLDSGYIDTFRKFEKGPGFYTWWSYRFQARSRNIGWRIDYHCVNSAFESSVVSAKIHDKILGSDHCPVHLEIR